MSPLDRLGGTGLDPDDEEEDVSILFHRSSCLVVVGDSSAGLHTCISAFQDGLFLRCPHDEGGPGRRALSSTTSTSAANLASKLDMWLSRVHIVVCFRPSVCYVQ